MATADVALGTMRVRQSTLSSACPLLAEARPPRYRPRGPPRPAAPSWGRAAPGAGLGDHGRARQGRSVGSAATLPGDLLDPPLLREAAGVGWPRSESETWAAGGVCGTSP